MPDGVGAWGLASQEACLANGRASLGISTFDINYIERNRKPRTTRLTTRHSMQIDSK
jgi:hypothetical protein